MSPPHPGSAVGLTFPRGTRELMVALGFCLGIAFITKGSTFLLALLFASIKIVVIFIVLSSRIPSL